MEAVFLQYFQDLAFSPLLTPQPKHETLVLTAQTSLYFELDHQFLQA